MEKASKGRPHRRGDVNIPERAMIWPLSGKDLGEVTITPHAVIQWHRRCNGDLLDRLTKARFSHMIPARLRSDGITQRGRALYVQGGMEFIVSAEEKDRMLIITIKPKQREKSGSAGPKQGHKKSMARRPRHLPEGEES